MNSLLHNTRKPDVTLHADGRIDIAARAARLLGLHPGDVVDIALDERGREAYIYVKHRDAVGRHEAQVYPTNRRGKICNNYRCHSKRITSTLLGDRQSAKLPAGDPVEIPCIGTALPLIIRYKPS
jgi:bifunctional DNA-binding transcriptional regulator/antitoxin component of YhaV-PrlF toxin-antitoxin module